MGENPEQISQEQLPMQVPVADELTNSESPQASESSPAPRKRGRPRKNPAPQYVTIESPDSPSALEATSPTNKRRRQSVTSDGTEREPREYRTRKSIDRLAKHVDGKGSKASESNAITSASVNSGSSVLHKTAFELFVADRLSIKKDSSSETLGTSDERTDSALKNGETHETVGNGIQEIDSSDYLQRESVDEMSEDELKQLWEELSDEEKAKYHAKELELHNNSETKPADSSPPATPRRRGRPKGSGKGASFPGRKPGRKPKNSTPDGSPAEVDPSELQIQLDHGVPVAAEAQLKTFPDNDTLIQDVREILLGANLQELTAKQVRKSLEVKYGCELSEKKEFLNN
ncbi:hypothetical protein HK098_000904, partial [Nowakowskiella sp. JEL0407]